VRSFILDCSVTMSWCFEDESGKYAASVLDAMADAEVQVPSIWPLEVANVLLVAERRRRITPVASAVFIRHLSGLPIRVAPGVDDLFARVLPLARSAGLSAYDAAYIELAQETCLPLASQNRAMRTAARKVGVELFAT